MSGIRRRAILAVGFCGLTVTGAATVAAQSPLLNPSRTSTYNLTFTDFAQFVDAMAGYYFTSDVTTSPGVPTGLAGHTVGTKSLHTGFFSGSTGNASTSHSLQSANLYNAPWSTTGGAGTVTYGYDTPVGADFNQSWIVAGVHNGRHTLDFVGGGAGFVAPLTGIVYRLVITINGDWTQFGTGFGQVEWLGYTGSGYSVNNFFTYANGVTTLEMSNDNWDVNSPNASFRLYGESVVPEPGTVVLLATGLLGLAAIGRARRPRRT